MSSVRSAETQIPVTLAKLLVVFIKIKLFVQGHPKDCGSVEYWV